LFTSFRIQKDIAEGALKYFLREVLLVLLFYICGFFFIFLSSLNFYTIVDIIENTLAVLSYLFLVFSLVYLKIRCYAIAMFLADAILLQKKLFFISFCFTENYLLLLLSLFSACFFNYKVGINLFVFFLFLYNVKYFSSFAQTKIKRFLVFSLIAILRFFLHLYL